MLEWLEVLWSLALENIALWHERDISHSSVERNIGPDANITTDFALVRLTNILNNMIVYPKKMLENLNITKGLIFFSGINVGAYEIRFK